MIRTPRPRSHGRSRIQRIRQGGPESSPPVSERIGLVLWHIVQPPSVLRTTVPKRLTRWMAGDRACHRRQMTWILSFCSRGLRSTSSFSDHLTAGRGCPTPRAARETWVVGSPDRSEPAGPPVRPQYHPAGAVRSHRLRRSEPTSPKAFGAQPSRGAIARTPAIPIGDPRC